MTALAIWQAAKRLWPFALGAGLLLWIGILTMQRNDARADAQSARNALAATEANYRAAAARRKADDLANVQRVAAEQGLISKETTDEYEARIAALRTDFAERVRIATGTHSGGSGGAHLPSTAATPSGADETACETKLPAQDALIASEQAEQLIALQGWARRVSTIDMKGN